MVGEKLPWDWPWGDDADMNAQNFNGDSMATAFGRRSVQHLTVRDLDEAKRFGLTAEAYDELRELFETRQKEKLREKVRDQVASELTTQLRSKIRDEIENEARKNAEAAFDADKRKELVQEIRNEHPNEKDIRAFRDMAREIELDCLAQRRSFASVVSFERRFATPSFLPFLRLLPWHGTTRKGASRICFSWPWSSCTS